MSSFILLSPLVSVFSVVSVCVSVGNKDTHRLRFRLSECSSVSRYLTLVTALLWRPLLLSLLMLGHL